MQTTPQSSTMYGYVTGDGKVYSIEFPADRLNAKQQKYADRGAVLTVSGHKSINPNPVTPPPSRPSSFDLGYDPNPVSKLALKHRDERRGGARENRQRAVVCITTEQYFPSIMDAALALDLQANSISSLLNLPPTNTLKGHRFRYATDEEKVARTFIAQP